MTLPKLCPQWKKVVWLAPKKSPSKGEKWNKY